MVSIHNERKIENNNNINVLSNGWGDTDSEFSSAVFQSELEELLTGTGKNYFTEKEVFAAIATEELSDNSEALSIFQNRFNEAFQSYGPERKNAYLYATNRAIKATREAGYLSRGEAHNLRARAMGAAQMDSNEYLLGSTSKTDMADQKYALSDILQTATAKMTNYKDGTEVALTRSQCRNEMKKLKGAEKNNSSFNNINNVLSFAASAEKLAEISDNEDSVKPLEAALSDETYFTKQYLESAMYPSLSSYLMALSLLDEDVATGSDVPTQDVVAKDEAR